MGSFLFANVRILSWFSSPYPSISPRCRPASWKTITSMPTEETYGAHAAKLAMIWVSWPLSFSTLICADSFLLAIFFQGTVELSSSKAFRTPLRSRAYALLQVTRRLAEVVAGRVELHGYLLGGKWHEEVNSGHRFMVLLHGHGVLKTFHEIFCRKRFDDDELPSCQPLPDLKWRSMIAPRRSSSIEFTTSSNIRSGRRSPDDLRRENRKVRGAPNVAFTWDLERVAPVSVPRTQSLSCPTAAVGNLRDLGMSEGWSCLLGSRCRTWRVLTNSEILQPRPGAVRRCRPRASCGVRCKLYCSSGFSHLRRPSRLP